MSQPHHDDPLINKTDARGARKTKHMRYILVISTLLAVVLLLFVTGLFSA